MRSATYPPWLPAIYHLVDMLAVDLDLKHRSLLELILHSPNLFRRVFLYLVHPFAIMHR